MGMSPPLGLAVHLLLIMVVPKMTVAVDVRLVMSVVFLMPMACRMCMVRAMLVAEIALSARTVPLRMVVGTALGCKRHVHAQAVDAVSGVRGDGKGEFLIQAELGQFGPQEVGGHAKAHHGGQVHVAG